MQTSPSLHRLWVPGYPAVLSCTYRHCSLPVPAWEGSSVAASMGPCTWLVKSGSLGRLIGLYARPCNEAGLPPDVSWWRGARMTLTLHCGSGLKVTPGTLHPCTGTRAVPFRKAAMNYFTEAHWHSHIKKQYTGATNNNMINSTVCVSRSRTLAASYYDRT